MQVAGLTAPNNLGNGDVYPKSTCFLTEDIHSLRHSFSTELTRRCEGDKTISQEVLGQSERISEQYVHLAEELEVERKHQKGQKTVKKVSF